MTLHPRIKGEELDGQRLSVNPLLMTPAKVRL
jgi:hypothetical protein